MKTILVSVKPRDIPKAIVNYTLTGGTVSNSTMAYLVGTSVGSGVSGGQDYTFPTNLNTWTTVSNPAVNYFYYPSFDYFGALRLFQEYLDGKDTVQKLPKVLSSGGFPPADLYEDADGVLHLEVTLAGWDEDSIDISFEESYLRLKLRDNEKEEDESRNYLQRGIRRSKSESEYFIPETLYNLKEISAKLNNGLLSVTIPRIEGKGRQKVKIES